jgi:cysteine desulfurase
MYFDYNATSPLRPCVKKLLSESLDLFGNPSSVHAYGREVRKHIEHARDQVGAYFKRPSKHVIFTSGATEANNLAIHTHNGPIIISGIEHDSLFVFQDRPHTHILRVNTDGIIDLCHLEELLTQTGSGTLVCVMAAHNETGVIQPIPSILELCEKHRAFLHLDAVQSVGKLSMDYSKIYSITCSGHKIGGLSGSGGLLKSSTLTPKTLIRGGGQERGYRSGTENALGILSLGCAIEDIQNDDFLKISRRINRFEAAVKEFAQGTITIFSEKVGRIGNTCNISMHNVKSELQLMNFDLKNIAVSTGSACSSGKVKISRSLKAMGVSDDLASSAIRISIGFGTTDEEIDTLIEAWKDIYTKLSPHSTSKENVCQAVV